MVNIDRNNSDDNSQSLDDIFIFITDEMHVAASWYALYGTQCQRPIEQTLKQMFGLTAREVNDVIEMVSKCPTYGQLSARMKW